MTEIRISHDDQPEDVIAKVNEALAEFGLKIVDDEQEHDGYCVFVLHAERGR